ncbi:MAG: hypothetical protein QM811_17915 [Pirellulales bacterium]
MSQRVFTLVCCLLLLAGCRQQSPAADAGKSPAAKESPAGPMVSTNPDLHRDRNASKPVAPLPAIDLKLLSWNIESDGSDPQVIFAQLKALGRYDVVALCEVPPKTVDLWKTGFTKGESVMSASGGPDRLLIAFDAARFELLRTIELDKHGDFVLNPGNQRAPLIVLLKDRATGYEFYVMNNHLARGNAEQRKKQALGISAWARDQAYPMIAVGDYNFDFDFPTEKGNEAFSAFLADGVWSWVRPAKLIDSNWDDRDGDGKDNFPDSLLDMVFVAGPAKAWTTTCEVIVRPGDFPDDKTTSDHRPVSVAVTIAPAK